MNKPDVIELLGRLAEVNNTFEKTRRLHNADLSAASRRLVMEAAQHRMSADQIADACHLTERNVRSIMRNEGVDPRRGINQIAKQAGQVLTDNAALMGLDVASMDLLSPLAYLPAGDVMRREIQDKAVSQVDEDQFTRYNKMADAIYEAMPWEGETYQAAAESIASALMAADL